MEPLLAFGQWVRANAQLRDVPAYLETAWNLGQPLIYEGAQGFGLDVVQGTVPFSTSSFTCLPELAGWVPPNLRRVMLRKAYETRVGGGPFPSRISDEAVHDRLRRAGNEYGASTGRPRDCGWLDVVVSRAAARAMRADSMFVTKLDVLAGFQPRVCCGYLLPEVGETVESWPTDPWLLEKATPSCQSMPAFEQGFLGARRVEEVPDGAMAYLHHMSELIGLKVGWLSTGPESNAVISFAEAS
jgi:adenylosuccinate synthase